VDSRWLSSGLRPAAAVTVVIVSVEVVIVSAAVETVEVSGAVAVDAPVAAASAMSVASAVTSLGTAEGVVMVAAAAAAPVVVVIDALAIEIDVIGTDHVTVDVTRTRDQGRDRPIRGVRMIARSDPLDASARDHVTKTKLLRVGVETNFHERSLDYQ